MKWLIPRPRVLVAIGSFFMVLNATAASMPDEAATKPLQFTSGGHIVGFTSKDVVLATGSHALRIEFVGAQRVEPVAAGSAATDTATPGVKAAPLTRVTYPGIWSGITLAYDAPAGLMRSTYTVAPGADPTQIRLRYNAPVAVEPGGGLRINFASGTMSESAPIAWQQRDGRRIPVSVGFRKESEREVGFALGAYDRARPLTIDPTLSWNTFLGGFANGVGSDYGRDIAVDASGNVYVTGYSTSTWGTPIIPMGMMGAAFVAKFDSDGTLVWNTFLRGYYWADGCSIAIDTIGKVYVTGSGASTWGNPIRPFTEGYSSGSPNEDAFVAKFDTDGTLLWNTFLGGYDNDYGRGISVDGGGNVYVAGEGYSTWGTPVRSFTNSVSDAFVAKLDTNGTLLWNTFLGGASGDDARGIAVDSNGIAFVTGLSDAPWGTPLLVEGGAFVAKVDTNGVLIWNTFLGGSGIDIVVGASGRIFVLGASTQTWGDPTIAFAGGTDAFIARLDTNGALIWNTFLGAGGDDVITNFDFGYGIAIDASDHVYATGISTGTWGNPILPYGGGSNGNVFVVKLDPDGILAWNAFLGSTVSDRGIGIAVDPSGNVYITGYSYDTWGSPILPWTEVSDAFVAKLGNAQPIASDQALETPINAAKEITLSATDADGDPLTYTVVDSPTHGTLSGTAPELTYQPADGFVGQDSFTFKVNDGSLDSNNATVNITVTADTTAPTGSILVNNGAAHTSTAAVTLNLSAADTGGSGLASMRFRNSTVEPYSAWEPYQTTKDWTLAGGAGTVKVYAQFADNAGNLSDANPAAAGAQGYMDAILFDPTAPTGSILINNGAASTGNAAVTLNLSASDGGGSGVKSMRFRASTAEPYGDWEPYKTTRSWILTSGLGIKKVYAQFMDNAGNISDANPTATGTQGYMDAIELVDKTAPTGSIQINDGAASTSNANVTLNLLAMDTGGSGIGSMRFRNSTSDAYSAWESYQSTKDWTLTSGAGSKKVYVQFKDAAGNLSDANPATAGSQGYADSIVYDPIETTDCEGCHDATPYQGINNGAGADAPSVMANYNVNGHGAKTLDPDGAGPLGARAVACADCHDISSPSPSTHLNGTFETYTFPGSTFGGPNTNTSHLVSAFFGTVGTEQDWQLNFDNNCYKNAYCHKNPPARGHRHEYSHKDGVVRFGNHYTVADPKRDRSPIPYWTPWTIRDISTDAPPGTYHYAPCVACHDPHGTDYSGYTYCPDTPDGNHHMLRINNCDTDYFCNSNCHRL